MRVNYGRKVTTSRTTWATFPVCSPDGARRLRSCSRAKGEQHDLSWSPEYVHITSRVWIQVVTVVVATLGLLFLVAGKDNKGSSKKPDIGRRTQSQNKGIVRIFKKLSDPNRLFTLLCLNPYPHSLFSPNKYIPSHHWRSPAIPFRGSPSSKVSLKKCDARCFTPSAIFALCPAYNLTTFQGFFRAFEEKEPKRKKWRFPT